MARQRKNHHARIVQDSPFLKLPFELREQIYFYILVRPIPIDLWPSKYDVGPPGDPLFRPFRLQEDLQFVRKEMATGLLTTCKQLYGEAGDIFWSRNTFRFSGDLEWFGVRRFLGQIGPRALSRIQSLELFAPLVDAHCLKTFSFGQVYRPYEFLKFYINTREAKNTPKMHMVKAQKQPWTGKVVFWQDGPTLERTIFVLTRNVQYVCHLMDVAKTSLDLKLVLPEGFGLDYAHGPVHGSSGEWKSMPWGESLWVQNNGIQLPEDMLRLLPFLTRSMTLVIEAGAKLVHLDLPEQFTKHGINVVCQAGSLLPTSPSERVLTKSSETKVWMEPSSKFDYVLGVSALFEEPLQISVAARGGRTTSKSNFRSSKRILKGFGGCRFVEYDEWTCVCPPLKNSKSQHKGRARARVEDDHHQAEGQYSVNKHLAIKKKGRAARNGAVSDKVPKEQEPEPEPDLDRAPEFELRICGHSNDSD